MERLMGKQLVEKVVTLLDAKKAADIRAIDVGRQTSLGDYFVIASAGSLVQARALADEVEEKLSEMGVEPRRIEGYQTANWILLDYSDVIVHIFFEESRSFYALDKLWADGVQLDISGLVKPE